MIKKFLFLILILLIAISRANASFEIANNSTFIDKVYNAGDKISGRINMSFDNEPNAKFTSNFQGGIMLYDLLLNMSYVQGVNFFCNPLSCMNSFRKTGLGSESQSFSIDEEKFYGFSTMGNISSLKINLTTNAGASCRHQINIDLLDDGNLEYYNDKYVEETCGEKNYGCYRENTNETQETILATNAYCEKINLSAAPAYKVGTTLYGNPVGKLQFAIYKEGSSNYLGYANLPENVALGGVEATIVPTTLQKENFSAFVCIKDTSASGNYKIKFKAGGCGAVFSGSQIIRGYDYEIFAIPYKYAPISEIKIEQTNVNSINNYLNRVYRGNCGTEGCIIPIKISGVNQNVILHSGTILYSFGGNFISSSIIYPLRKENFRISSNFSLLDIGKMNFITPNVGGNRTFELYFNNEEIASQRITIKKGFNFDMGPLSARVGIETFFTILGEKNISYSEWDFGDGSLKKIVNGNSVAHTYFNASIYDVEVKARSTDGEESVKKFKVIAGGLTDSVNISIVKNEKKIAKLKTDLLILNTWIKPFVESQIDINSYEANIRKIKEDYNLLGQNAPSSEYVGLLNRLSALNIPSRVTYSDSGKLPIELFFDSIDVSYIKEISTSSPKIDDETIKKRILAWYAQNYDVAISYQVISAVYETNQKKLVSYYKIDLAKKSDSAEEGYLIINYPIDSIIFKSDYHATKVANGRATSIRISDGKPSSIEFVIKGENAPKFSELGVYISGDISKLNPAANEPTGVIDLFRAGWKFLWDRFLLGILFVIILLFIIYILLQTWYKKKYEKHLFKNPDDLYNVIYFIYNSRKSGFSDEAIKKKLKEKKWTGEQIRYAFNKIDGKRTGMWEIPIFKFIENKKIKKEIENKQGGMPIDNRFVMQRGDRMRFFVLQLVNVFIGTCLLLN